MYTNITFYIDWSLSLFRRLILLVCHFIKVCMDILIHWWKISHQFIIEKIEYTAIKHLWINFSKKEIFHSKLKIEQEFLTIQCITPIIGSNFLCWTFYSNRKIDNKDLAVGSFFYETFYVFWSGLIPTKLLFKIYRMFQRKMNPSPNPCRLCFHY